MMRHYRGVVKRFRIVDALGRTQEVRVLSEPDVPRLIIGSELPSAKKREKWAFLAVLPTIHKTGGYMAAGCQTASNIFQSTASKTFQFMRSVLVVSSSA